MNSLQSKLPSRTVASPFRVAVVGGGPGGLMAAYLLQQRCGPSCSVTIFEAGSRLGGKIVTRKFDTIDARYEAGVAELYDYSQLGPDPLRELVAEMGLATSPMNGPTVVLDGRFLSTDDDIRRECGPDTLSALDRLDRKSRRACSTAEYYESDWKADNDDPLARKSFAEFLDEIADPTARRYVEVAVHSDLATEPHHTSAMYGIQNWLMNDPAYMKLYTIDGGIERLPEALAGRIDADVKIEHRVRRIGLAPSGRYRVESSRGGAIRSDEFDFVAVALPQNWLARLEWDGEALAKAMRAHHAHYDHPAHYLRVTLVFDRPFWRERVSGSFFMLDAFGGCCAYDDSLRTPSTSHGILSWLIAGNAATTLANLDDAALVDEVLLSLPPEVRPARSAVLESKVHRWLGSVNGWPMGYPVREPDSRHRPEPVGHPGLFLVGDYLFDSTLNGVLDSADTVVELIREAMSPPVGPVPVLAVRLSADLASFAQSK